MLILDTNVVSALRVRGRNPTVEAWAMSVPVADQFVAAFTIAEIERGVVSKERSDTRQGAVLRQNVRNPAGQGIRLSRPGRSQQQDILIQFFCHLPLLRIQFHKLQPLFFHSLQPLSSLSGIGFQ